MSWQCKYVISYYPSINHGVCSSSFWVDIRIDPRICFIILHIDLLNFVFVQYDDNKVIEHGTGKESETWGFMLLFLISIHWILDFFVFVFVVDRQYSKMRNLQLFQNYTVLLGKTKINNYKRFLAWISRSLLFIKLLAILPKKNLYRQWEKVYCYWLF